MLGHVFIIGTIGLISGRYMGIATLFACLALVLLGVLIEVARDGGGALAAGIASLMALQIGFAIGSAFDVADVDGLEIKRYSAERDVRVGD